MHPRLRRIPAQSPTIRIPRHPIHNRPANRTRLIDLQPQIIMQTRHRMIVLMYDEMPAVGVLISSVEILERGD